MAKQSAQSLHQLLKTISQCWEQFCDEASDYLAVDVRYINLLFPDVINAQDGILNNYLDMLSIYYYLHSNHQHIASMLLRQHIQHSSSCMEYIH